jgi:hypothetical protein
MLTLYLLSTVFSEVQAILVSKDSDLLLRSDLYLLGTTGTKARNLQLLFDQDKSTFISNPVYSLLQLFIPKSVAHAAAVTHPEIAARPEWRCEIDQP